MTTLLEYTRGSYAVPLVIRLCLWFFSLPLRLVLGLIFSQIRPWQLYRTAQPIEPFLLEGHTKILGLTFRYRVVEYPESGGPYLLRVYLFKKWRERFPGVFLHYFFRSDADRDLHNHPWDWAVSLILKGGYYEHTHWDVETFRPGQTNLLLAASFHRVELLNPAEGCWSLFIAGPREKRLWGFLDEQTGEFLPAREYRHKATELADARGAELAALHAVEQGIPDARVPDLPATCRECGCEPDEYHEDGCPFAFCDGFAGCAPNGVDYHDPDCCANH